MAGPLDFFGSDPELRYADIDDNTKNILAGGIDRASQSNDQITNRMNEGVSERANQLTGPSSKQENARLGGDPAMTDAIRNKYNAYAGKQVDKLKGESALNAPFEKARQLKQYSAAAIGQQNAKTMFYQQLTDAYNQQEMQRAEFVSQLFQTGTQAYMYSKMNNKPMQNSSQGPAAPNFNIPDINSDGRVRTGGYAPSNTNYGFNARDYA